MDEITVHLLSPSGARTNYKAEWVYPGTTRRNSRSLKTDDPALAEKMRGELEYELNHGIYTPRAATGWVEFRTRYFDEVLSGKRPRTRVSAAAVFDRLERQIGPAMPAALDETLLGRHTAGLRRAGFKPHTVAKHLAYLKAALRWAERVRIIPRCPRFEGVKLPRKKFIRTTDWAGVEKFVDSLRESEKATWGLLARVAWYTGLRCGELFSLRWEQTPHSPWLDFNAKRVIIPAEACKADEDQWVPMHPELIAMLEPHRRAAGGVFDCAPTDHSMSQGFSSRARRAGLAFTLHDLRRSFGSRYARVVPAQVLQRLMRHASITTTLKFYVDLGGAVDDAITLA